MTKYKSFNLSKYRVLLSEVLPYELPMFFSSRKFFEFAAINKLGFEQDGKTLSFHKKNVSDEWKNIVLKLLNGNSPQKKSFSFFINKDRKAQGRELTLIHPYMAVKMADFYNDCAGQIINSCRKSEFSIRFPHHVATRIKKRLPLVPQIVLKNSDYNVKEPKTYFFYHDFRNINTFYDSKTFLRLQGRFQHFCKLDISHCFDNVPCDKIYQAAYNVGTEAKNDNNFATRFEKLMKEMRTKDNGIIIGPEFSRLFAEIILQRVDVEIKNDMDKAGENLHIDYECFRYVDDMLFFYNSKHTKDHFLKIYDYRLMQWGMKRNPDKYAEEDTPVVTPQTTAKREIQLLIDELTNNCLETAEGLSKIRNGKYDIPYGMEAKFAYRDFLVILRKNTVEPDQVSSYLFFKLHKKLCRAIDQYDSILNEYLKADEEDLLDEEGEKIELRYTKGLVHYLKEMVKFVFLVFHTDKRMSSSIRVVSIIDCIIQYANSRLFPKSRVNLQVNFRNDIYKCVFDELQFCLRNYKLQQLNGLEICNVLTLMKDIPEQYYFSNTTLQNFLNEKLNNPESDINFLMVFALMQGLRKCNEPIKKRCITWLLGRLKLKEFDIDDAECFYITFGILTLREAEKYKGIGIASTYFNKQIFGDMTKLSGHSLFMQWKGTSLQKACTEKVAGDVY